VKLFSCPSLSRDTFAPHPHPPRLIIDERNSYHHFGGRDLFGQVEGNSSDKRIPSPPAGKIMHGMREGIHTWKDAESPIA